MVECLSQPWCWQGCYNVFMWITLLVVAFFLVYGLLKVAAVLAHVVGTSLVIWGFWKLSELLAAWLLPHLTISLTCVGVLVAAACFRVVERRRLTPPPGQAMLPPMSNASPMHAHWWRPS